MVRSPRCRRHHCAGRGSGWTSGMFLTNDVTTQLGTFALVPQIAHNVRIPVIAAGGIADSRGIKAAMTLGAEAVQLGTAYMLCSEAKTSPCTAAPFRALAPSTPP